MNKTYFHTSAIHYHFPCLDAIDSHMDVGRAAKAVLGYYVSHKPLDTKKPYIYEITLCVNARVLRWPLSEMVYFYEIYEFQPQEIQISRWRELRNEISLLYDFIEIVECDETVGEAVIVNLDCITSFKCIKKGTKIEDDYRS